MDFPANNQAAKLTGPPGEDSTLDEGKKVQKVITGTVSRAKRSLGKRFMETFIGGDAKSAFQYVIFEVLIPAAKDTVADMVSGGIERILFDGVRSAARRGASRPSGTSGYVSYNRFSQTPKREEPREMARRARTTHNFDEIVIDSRHEAEEVIGQLYELINNYNHATVADLFDLVGWTPAYTDQSWGWTDLRGARVVRISNGYLLDLPKPDQLDIR